MNRIEAAAVRHAGALNAFAAVARRCCWHIEEWWALPQQYDICALLADLERLLPEVSAAAASLPPTGDWFFDDETPDEEDARQHAQFDFAQAVHDALLMRSLTAALGRFAYYPMVFDPYRVEPDPTHASGVDYGSLGDDVESVYGWLKGGLILLDEGTVPGTFGAAWNWRFDYDIHAGEHLTGAMRAIYFIRRRYLNQDDDEEDEGSDAP